MSHLKSTETALPFELKDVSFEARGMRLIKDFNCTFAAGPRTIIIGPNGAGKSLLLRLCHGLLKPTTGSIEWHGKVKNPSNHQAMVFQRPTMLRRSVAANIDYALKLKKIPKTEREELIMEALSLTGLKRHKDKPARILSFGEQQKLALARAWALRPEVLFLDEPAASLDPSATHSIEEIIQTIHTAGTRIIMTTHDLGQARRMADEILFLHRGRLLEKAPAEQFFEEPKNDLARAFLHGDLLWWRRGKDHRPQQNDETGA